MRLADEKAEDAFPIGRVGEPVVMLHLPFDPDLSDGMMCPASACAQRFGPPATMFASTARCRRDPGPEARLGRRLPKADRRRDQRRREIRPTTGCSRSPGGSREPDSGQVSTAGASRHDGREVGGLASASVPPMSPENSYDPAILDAYRQALDEPGRRSKTSPGSKILRRNGPRCAGERRRGPSDRAGDARARSS